MKAKLKDLLFKNERMVALRRYFIGRIFPYFRKIFLLTIAIFLTTFLFLYFFNKDFLEKNSQKFTSYAISRLKLDNYDFSAINISGNSRITNEEILRSIKEITKDFRQNPLDNPSLMKKMAQEIKNRHEWINYLVVSRSLPNALNVTILEFEPFAIWQEKNQKYVIDRDGNKIKIENDEEFKNLLILSGKNANLHVKSLFNMLAINPEINARVYSATWVGDRRWDIRFEDGLLIKLPASNLHEAWKDLILLYNMPNSTKNLISIDLRIDKKIYLKYNDKRTKEILNFKY